MSSILSVSQLNKYVAFKLKSDVKLKGVCVKGEISNYNLNYRSGHHYFTVKDEQSCIKAVMFAGSAARLKTELKDGMSVLVVGNVEIYEAGGTYQIIATDITPLGSGAVHNKTELIKEKLYKMGIFDEKNKKPIPDRCRVRNLLKLYVQACKKQTAASLIRSFSRAAAVRLRSWHHSIPKRQLWRCTTAAHPSFQRSVTR